ncbi:DNA-J related domain-containing protein [Oceanicoccus sagamiensis]|uniref:J domain-containing protein n=1 Tax=Oceanicoccus sagamiensis TaxID=716816 RepID=A0A1X9NL11_9GAMM|nr:DNA-J related domain-containing protein [Oceanicoccus sagamiensis]ARN74633.1 hypothetical protein BST96_11165 [Oceanicoccus sagamiensis]
MSEQSNPLVVPILAILKTAERSLSEYEVIGELQQRLHTMDKSALAKPLALFQTHFLVMNALYQLQATLLEEDLQLVVSPLTIEIRAKHSRLTTELAEEGVEASLRSYYLDWSNMEATTAADVDSLLTGFWQYYLAEDKQLEAYIALGLDAGAPWPDVQQRYRSLVAEHHPDRGGDAAKFMAIREAYEILQKTAVIPG